MKKQYLLLIALLTAITITGCKGNKDNPGAETDSTGSTAATQESSTAEASVEDVTGTEAPAAQESSARDLSVDYPFAQRFIYADKNLFYINDDGSLDCEFKCDDKQTLDYGVGDSDHYYFLVNGEGSQTLYFLDRQMELSFTPITYPEGMYVNCIDPYKNKVYYYGYDNNAGRYATYFYDPSGDAFDNDPEIDSLERHLTNYKGRGLTRLFSNTSMIREITTTGNIYMQDIENKEIYVFDDGGNERKILKDTEEDGEFIPYGPEYLLKKFSYYGDGERKTSGGQEYVLYEIRTGNTYPFKLGDNPQNVGIADIKGGYVYYYENNIEKEITTSRKYSRIPLSDIKEGKTGSEEVLTIPLYTNVNTSYGSYTEGNNGYDGFTVKDDRIYYLVFDEKGEDGKKGDVVWRSIPLDAFSEDNVQHTGAMERHETFADFGTLTEETDIRIADDSDGFIYFKGDYQSFRLDDSFENADKLNEEIKEIEQGFRNVGDGMAESAYNDIVVNGEEGNDIAWFKEFIGYGYTYDATFGGVKNVGKNHLEISYNDYSYYGGAHGTGGSNNYLFNKKTGKPQTFKDIYKGTEEEFKETALQYSMDDWRKNSSYYYYEDNGSKENEDTMRESFKEYINIDMNIDYNDTGIVILYPPYGVGPYASGEIAVEIPYYALNIEDM